MTDIDPALGARVRRLREVASLTQQEVADKIGVLRSTVANIETGRQGISLNTGISLAQVLGTTIGVIAGTEPMPPSSTLPAVTVESRYTVVCTQCGEVCSFAKRQEASQCRDEHRVPHPPDQPEETS